MLVLFAQAGGIDNTSLSILVPGVIIYRIV